MVGVNVFFLGTFHYAGSHHLASVLPHKILALSFLSIELGGIRASAFPYGITHLILRNVIVARNPARNVSPCPMSLTHHQDKVKKTDPG